MIAPDSSAAGYEIRVKGVIDRHWTGWSGEMRVDADGTHSVISGLLPDQPALQGSTG